MNPEGSQSPKPVSSTQQRNTMITKNGILRPNRNISLISNPKLKPKVSETTEIDPESEIDFSNIPTIKGTYTAIKLNATGAAVPKKEEAPVTVTTTTTTMLPPISSAAAISSIPSTTMRVETTTSTRIPPTAFMNSGSSSTDRIVPAESGFNEFREPDLETSPWRPIVPPYLNTDIKMGPNIVTTAASTTTSAKSNHQMDNLGKYLFYCFEIP